MNGFEEITMEKPEAYIRSEKKSHGRIYEEDIKEEIEMLKQQLNTLNRWNGSCIAVLSNLKPGMYIVDDTGGGPDYMPWNEAVEYFCDWNLAIPVTVKNGIYKM